MQFNKQDLIDICRDESEKYKVISEKTLDESRWHSTQQVIFQDPDTGKFFEAYYRRGLTEYQENEYYEGEPDLIDCPEMEQYEKTIIEWRKIA